MTEVKVLFLLGEYQNRIDPRGRAFIPVKFRDVLGSPIYMIINGRKCIECYNEDGIKAKYESAIFKNASPLRKETIASALFSNGDTQPIDNQGRIILKPDYIESIGADKDVVFLGAYDHFEIWAKDEYELMKQEVGKAAAEVNNIGSLEEEVGILEKKAELMRRKKALMAEMEENG